MELQARLRSQFGLTEAECSVGVAIAEGRTLSEIAAARGVSVFTVRNQLKSTFAKTRTRRQSELILLIHGLHRPE